MRLRSGWLALLLGCVGITALPWVALPELPWHHVLGAVWMDPTAPTAWHLWQTGGWRDLGAQPWGLGMLLVATALAWALSLALARVGAFRGDPWLAASVVVMTVLLLTFVAYPVALALRAAWIDDAGQWSWDAGLNRLFDDRHWGLGCLSDTVHCGAAWNTLFMGIAVGISTTVLGLALALLAERGGHKPGGWLQKGLNWLALLPIVTPPFVIGLGLILLFGRAGLTNQALEWALGLPPSRWFYGALGLWMAQVFAFTPIAFLLLRGVVQGISPSLEEAALTLGARPSQVLRTITWPLMRTGLANAFLIGFIESVADFGNPIVVGGSFPVLSTEIFFAIVGAQFDPGRAAGLAWLLTLFALGVFMLQQHWIGKRTYATLSGKGDAGLIHPLPKSWRRVLWALVLPLMGVTLLIYVLAFAGGFVKTWGRDYSLTWQHMATAFGLAWTEYGLAWVGTAWHSLWTTLKLATISAPLAAFLGLLMAWVLHRHQFLGRRALEFFALMSFAIPGTVLGVSYVVAFNVPPLELTGSATIIVLSFLFRNLPLGLRAGTASLAQIDRSLEEASALLRASTPQTWLRVLLPLLRPALLAALLYSLVRAITTVSAVIFLVTAEYDLATTYIMGRVGNGDYGVALAYCSVLMGVMLLSAGALQWAVGERQIGRRTAQEIGHGAT